MCVKSLLPVMTCLSSGRCSGYRRRMTLRQYLSIVGVAILIGCTGRRASKPVPQPRIIPHTQWQSQPPLGYAADAARRNKRAGDFANLRAGTAHAMRPA